LGSVLGVFEKKVGFNLRGDVKKKQYIYRHCPNRRGRGQTHFKKLKKIDFLTKVGEGGGLKT
jgi:hypothetical protein